MPSKKTNSERTGVSPVLAVPTAEATAKISRRIEDGEALLATHPRSRDQLEKLREAYHIWSDYNRELLSRIFTSSAVAEEYAEPAGGAFSFDPTLEQQVGYVHRDVSRSLTRLRSVLGRLELFPSLDVGKPPAAHTSTTDRRVFLVHGHDGAAKESVARFLEKLGLNVVILHERADAGQTIIEKLVAHADVAYAVVLLTGDDVGAKKGLTPELRPRARQNVLLELGYFLGRLGRGKVRALVADGVEVPSDYSGVLYTELDAGGAWKFALAREIKESGLDVDLNKVV
ncbi:MAG: nucleotide-binding protein [Planctomycetes bacterium]|nr:nucleotide-binding protein [Planctomycetota bacterium]